MLSIVIETENEAQHNIVRLDDTIRALKAQTLPLERCEVLVMVRQSEAHVAEPIRQALPEAKITLLPDPVGYGQMKLHGARLSRYPIVAFLDSDCIPTRDWTAHILEEFRTAPEDVAVLQGRTKCLDAPGAGFFTMRFFGSPWKYAEESDWIVLNNFAMRTSMMEQYPFANVPVRQGAEYPTVKGLLRDGKKIRIVPQMLITHNYAPGLWSWFVQGQSEAFDYAEMVVKVMALSTPAAIITWRTKFYRMCWTFLWRTIDDLRLALRLRRRFGFHRESPVACVMAAVAYWTGGVVGFANWKRGKTRPEALF